MQIRSLIGLFLVFFIVPGIASAHGPSRQKLKKSIEINAPADKVWAIIKNFDDMSWHPAVKKTMGKGGNAIKATRVLDLGGGAVINEELYKYNDKKMSYSYRITGVDVKVLPVNDYSSHLTVTSNGKGKSMVEWKGAFYRGFMNNDPPAELNEAAAIKAVSGVYEGGLANIKKLAEGGM